MLPGSLSKNPKLQRNKENNDDTSSVSSSSESGASANATQGRTFEDRSMHNQADDSGPAKSSQSNSLKLYPRLGDTSTSIMEEGDNEKE